eukprot:gene5492-2232_t
MDDGESGSAVSSCPPFARDCTLHPYGWSPVTQECCPPLPYGVPGVARLEPGDTYPPEFTGAQCAAHQRALGHYPRGTLVHLHALLRSGAGEGAVECLAGVTFQLGESADSPEDLVVRAKVMGMGMTRDEDCPTRVMIRFSLRGKRWRFYVHPYLVWPSSYRVHDVDQCSCPYSPCTPADSTLPAAPPSIVAPPSHECAAAAGSPTPSPSGAPSRAGADDGGGGAVVRPGAAAARADATLTATLTDSPAVPPSSTVEPPAGPGAADAAAGTPTLAPSGAPSQAGADDGGGGAVERPGAAVARADATLTASLTDSPAVPPSSTVEPPAGPGASDAAAGTPTLAPTGVPSQAGTDDGGGGAVERPGAAAARADTTQTNDAVPTLTDPLQTGPAGDAGGGAVERPGAADAAAPTDAPPAGRASPPTSSPPCGSDGAGSDGSFQSNLEYDDDQPGGAALQEPAPPRTPRRDPHTTDAAGRRHPPTSSPPPERPPWCPRERCREPDGWLEVSIWPDEVYPPARRSGPSSGDVAQDLAAFSIAEMLGIQLSAPTAEGRVVVGFTEPRYRTVHYTGLDRLHHGMTLLNKSLGDWERWMTKRVASIQDRGMDEHDWRGEAGWWRGERPLRLAFRLLDTKPEPDREGRGRQVRDEDPDALEALIDEVRADGLDLVVPPGTPVVRHRGTEEHGARAVVRLLRDWRPGQSVALAEDYRRRVVHLRWDEFLSPVRCAPWVLSLPHDEWWAHQARNKDLHPWLPPQPNGLICVEESVDGGAPVAARTITCGIDEWEENDAHVTEYRVDDITLHRGYLKSVINVQAESPQHRLDYSHASATFQLPHASPSTLYLADHGYMHEHVNVFDTDELLHKSVDARDYGTLQWGCREGDALARRMRALRGTRDAWRCPPPLRKTRDQAYFYVGGWETYRGRPRVLPLAWHRFSDDRGSRECFPPMSLLVRYRKVRDEWLDGTARRPAPRMLRRWVERHEQDGYCESARTAAWRFATHLQPSVHTHGVAVCDHGRNGNCAGCGTLVTDLV